MQRPGRPQPSAFRAIHRFDSANTVTHPFRVLKQQFGYTKVQYRGLKKNTVQIVTLFALSKALMERALGAELTITWDTKPVRPSLGRPRTSATARLARRY